MVGEVDILYNYLKEKWNYTSIETILKETILTQTQINNARKILLNAGYITTKTINQYAGNGQTLCLQIAITTATERTNTIRKHILYRYLISKNYPVTLAKIQKETELTRTWLYDNKNDMVTAGAIISMMEFNKEANREIEHLKPGEKIYVRHSRICPVCRTKRPLCMFPINSRLCFSCKFFTDKLGSKGNPNKVERAVFVRHTWLHTKNLHKCYREWWNDIDPEDWQKFRKALRYLGGSVSGGRRMSQEEYYNLGKNIIKGLVKRSQCWDGVAIS